MSDTFTFSGTITDPTATPVASVSLTSIVNGQPGPSATSASNGTWQLAGIPKNASVTVTPALSGYVFSPSDYAEQDIGADNTDIDFAATQVTFSGTVYALDSSAATASDFLQPLPNVAVNLTAEVGGVQGVHAVQTDTNGVFSFQGVDVGTSYSISLVCDGYTQAIPVPYEGVAQASTLLMLAMYPSDQEGEPGQAVWAYVVEAVSVAMLAVATYQVFIKDLLAGIFASVSSSLPPIGATASAVASAIRSLTADDVMAASGSDVELQQLGSTTITQLLDSAVDTETVANDVATQTAVTDAKNFVKYLVEQGAEADMKEALNMLDGVQSPGYDALIASLQAVRNSSQYQPELAAAMTAIKTELDEQLPGTVTGTGGTLSDAGQQALSQLATYQEFLDFTAEYSGELFTVSQDAFVYGGVLISSADTTVFAYLLGAAMDFAMC